MSRGRNASSAALAALAILATGATGASATSIQTVAGAPYVGTLEAELLPGTSALLTNSLGTVTCNRSSPRGAITDPGSLGNPAIGSISSIDFENTPGGEACPDDITFGAADHQDFIVFDLPWVGRTDWLNDNLVRQPNGTDTFAGVRLRASFDTVVGDLECEYVGDFGNTGGTTRAVQGDLYNPDNTLSGHAELDFKNEPFERLVFNASCPATATLTATYAMTGGGAELEIRAAPVPPAPAVTDSDPDSPADVNSPAIKGSAQAGSTVQLYTNSTCTAAVPGASAAAASFALPGITVAVADNTTTTFFAKATNPGGSSLCSAAGLTYVESTPAPIAAPAIAQPPPVATPKCKKSQRLKRGKCVKKKKKKKK